MGGVTQECSDCFLVTKMKKSHPGLLRVGLKVKKEVNLVRSRLWPFFEFVKDIECNKHSISVWSNLKGGNTEVVCHPLIERM